MNRKELKAQSKRLMSLATPHPVLMTLVMLATAIGFSFAFLLVIYLLFFIIAFAVTDSFSNPQVLETTGMVLFMAVYIILVLVLCLIMGVIGYNYTNVYFLKVWKEEYSSYKELFANFRMAFKILGLYLWICLFYMLWCLLFLIPGIIALMRYSQALYILAEDPSKGIRQCVNESKAMMKGHLWEYFVLNLSFIPWILLTYITCCIAVFYAAPYMQTTLAGYYLHRKTEYTSSNAIS